MTHLEELKCEVDCYTRNISQLKNELENIRQNYEDETRIVTKEIKYQEKRIKSIGKLIADISNPDAL